ncbi:MAG: mechanosensitive ion channel family protein [Ruminococcus sp.]|nr:mechanosensitive ion channel family protein [Ruminococcus sp.]
MFDFTKLWEKFLEILPDIGFALLILAVGLLVTFIIARVAKAAMTKANLDLSLVGFFVRVIKIAGVVIVLIAALSKLGVSTTGLIASFSAALAAVALALKDSLSDIASGIIILFTKPFVTGDFIEFGDTKGFVQKIDMLHTNLLTYDETNVIIPNSKITSEKLSNYTSHSQIRVLIQVPIPYSADIEVVKKVLLDTMDQEEKILKDEKHTPSVKLENYGDSALNFTTRCYCDFEDYWTVYFSLTEKFKANLDKADIEIPFNQLDVHIVENVK